jgi:hypothetical protein
MPERIPVVSSFCCRVPSNISLKMMSCCIWYRLKREHDDDADDADADADEKAFYGLDIRYQFKAVF